MLYPLALNCSTYNSRIVPVLSYVAQLVPLPKSFEDKMGMCSAIRPPHCMRTSDFYQLHKLGGPNSGPSQHPVQQLFAGPPSPL